MINKIQKLRELINHYNEKYFNEQISEISDEEYDKLLLELHTLEEKAKLDKTMDIGFTPENTFKKVEHKQTMFSLLKLFNRDDLYGWLNKNYGKITDLVLELKMDGLALSLKYENGKLVCGSTRGNGYIGEDITNSVLLIDNIPKTIDYKDDIEIRGEIILPKEGLDTINKMRKSSNQELYKNVRNAASGIIRNKQPIKDYCKYLKFKAYILLDNKSYLESVQMMKNFGFDTVNDIDSKTIKLNDVNKNTDEILDFINYINNKRNTYEFDIDGIVLKCNDINEQLELGYKDKRPNWAISYKFEAKNGVTKLIGVEHLLGSKGNVTPRAILEPVKIDGSIITKPTLHNYEEIKRLDLKIGDYVLVEKRGDVIPKITKVYTELRTGDEINIEEPQYCPECGNKLIKQNIFIRCDNKNCFGRKLFKIVNYCMSMDIKDFGQKKIEKLVENNVINCIEDLYKLTPEKFEGIEGFAEKSINTIINNIEKSKLNSLDKVIAGLTIENVGVKMSKEFAKRFKTLENFKNAKIENFYGFGEVVSKNTLKWIINNQELLNNLIELNVYSEQIKETKLDGISFSFTGKLSNNRKFYENEIIKNGGIIGNINKKLNYLVIGDGAKEHKIEKAKLYNINVINENEFNKLMEEYNV